LSFSSTSRQQLPAESVVIDRFETGKDEDGADRLTKLSALEEEEEKGACDYCQSGRCERGAVSLTKHVFALGHFVSHDVLIIRNV
jgi:hypothetical protein